ncbi:MAG: hypothetical protein IPH16_10645 [Haliscomenobacter sp.]|nr:hypothetical protein [Haliscomenobacter sp.]
MALYAPGVALGGINLLTGTTKELGCIDQSDCDKNAKGQTAKQIQAPKDGVYFLAITRNYGSSCGSDGTYLLRITSNGEFNLKNQTGNDIATKASGFECIP